MIDNVDRSNIYLKAFENWIETFKSNNTPEEDRIIDYKWGGYGTDESNQEKIKATVDFTVTPYNKEHTNWYYAEPKKVDYNGQEFTIQSEKNVCYIEMTNVNGEYQVDYISTTPKNYDKFLERFKEYKNNNSEIITTAQIQAEEPEKQLANQKIEKMSNIIWIVCAIALTISVLGITTKLVKRKK